MNEADEIPWGKAPLGESFWLAEAASGRWSVQQAKFAACRQARFTQARAAKLAGYSGDADQLRKIGSATDKTVGVIKMRQAAEMALVLNGQPQPEQPLLSREDRRRLLSDLARSKDPGVSIRAIEALEKGEKAEQLGDFDLVNDDGFNFERNIRNLLMQPGGAIIVVASLARPGSGYGLSGLPLLHDIIAMLKEQDPDYLDLLRRRENNADLASLDQKLANPSWQRDTRIKVWGEMGMTLEEVAAKLHRLNKQESERLSA